MAGRCIILGIGNPDRGDDAVGRTVAAKLRGLVPEAVRVCDLNGEMVALLDHFEGAESVYIVDAAVAENGAGTIHRFDVADKPLPQNMLSLSTHGFGVAEAVEMARAMGTLPPACVVFAIEGKEFEAGRPPDPAVEKAADEVARQILTEIGGGQRGKTCTKHR